MVDYIGLLDAAKAAEKKKSTILRRIKHHDENKRIVAEQAPDGTWKVNLHSLMQHYSLPPEGIKFLEDKYATNATARTSAQTQRATPVATANATTQRDFEHHIELLEQQVAFKDRTIEGLQKDKEQLARQVETFAETVNKQTLLITARNELPKHTPAKPTIRSWLAWTAFALLLGSVSLLSLERSGLLVEWLSENRFLALLGPIS